MHTRPYLNSPLPWLCLILPIGFSPVLAPLEAKHPLPGPHYVDCSVEGNSVRLSWDALGISPNHHRATLQRDGEFLAELPPDSLEYIDQSVPTGLHFYRLDIVQLSDERIFDSFGCLVEVGLETVLRCEALGGIAVPPAVLLDWPPLPSGLPAESILVRRDGEIIGELEASAQHFEDELPEREHTYSVSTRLDATFHHLEVPIGECNVKFDIPPIGGFVRGDINADGTSDISDAIYILVHLFSGGPAPTCAQSGDTDDNGELQITDGIYLLNHLFGGGPPPPLPYPDCAEDTTPDTLGCEKFSPCFHPPPP